MKYSIKTLGRVYDTDLKSIRRVLSGEYNAKDINNMFLWDSTPQGHNRWELIYLCKCDRLPISITGNEKRFLEELLVYVSLVGKG